MRSVDLGGRTAATREVAGIPGRYFSMELSGLQKVRAIAHAADGRVLGQLGDTAPANAGPPQSYEEARAQGNLSGFAPGVELPTSMTYQGKPVTADQIVAKKLSCTEDSTATLVCKDR